jgi:TetR/AcrR family transcriptional repressor of nem operon
MGRVSDAKQRLMNAVLELIWQGSYGSTTIDQICERSGVKKGSFYHFFDSKCDAALAAMEESWEKRKAEMDALFSPTVPPLERIRKFCEEGYQSQAELKRKFGTVLGCPLFTLGAEICTQESDLRAKVKMVFGCYHQYLESAIRDAAAAKLIHAPDPAGKARVLFAFTEGLMTQARILNDAEVLRELWHGAEAILGIESSAKRH